MRLFLPRNEAFLPDQNLRSDGIFRDQDLMRAAYSQVRFVPSFSSCCGRHARITSVLASPTDLNYHLLLLFLSFSSIHPFYPPPPSILFTTSFIPLSTASPFLYNIDTTSTLKTTKWVSDRAKLFARKRRQSTRPAILSILTATSKESMADPSTTKATGEDAEGVAARLVLPLRPLSSKSNLQLLFHSANISLSSKVKFDDNKNDNKKATEDAAGKKDCCDQAKDHIMHDGV
jgi:hypothetical protein